MLNDSFNNLELHGFVCVECQDFHRVTLDEAESLGWISVVEIPSTRQAIS